MRAFKLVPYEVLPQGVSNLPEVRDFEFEYLIKTFFIVGMGMAVFSHST